MNYRYIVDTLAFVIKCGVSCFVLETYSYKRYKPNLNK